MMPPIHTKSERAKTLLARIAFFFMSIIPARWSDFFWYRSVSVIDGVIYLPVGDEYFWGKPDAFRLTPTYRHELIHIEQAKRKMFWQLRYVLSPAFRIDAEAEAYTRVQIAEGRLSIDNVVDIIATNYFPLWETRESIREAVWKYIIQEDL